MSIQSFAEELHKRLDTAFEKEANRLLNEARNENKQCPNIAGKIDGLHAASAIIKEVYALFVTEEKPEDDETRALY